MICSKCGKEIPEGSRFCGYCGAVPSRPKVKKKQVCPGCGKKVSATSPFCGYCGKPLALSEETASASVQHSDKAAEPKPVSRASEVTQMPSDYNNRTKPEPVSSVRQPRPAQKSTKKKPKSKAVSLLIIIEIIVLLALVIVGLLLLNDKRGNNESVSVPAQSNTTSELSSPQPEGSAPLSAEEFVPESAAAGEANSDSVQDTAIISPLFQLFINNVISANIPSDIINYDMNSEHFYTFFPDHSLFVGYYEIDCISLIRSVGLNMPYELPYMKACYAVSGDLLLIKVYNIGLDNPAEEDGSYALFVFKDNKDYIELTACFDSWSRSTRVLYNDLTITKNGVGPNQPPEFTSHIEPDGTVRMVNGRSSYWEGELLTDWVEINLDLGQDYYDAKASGTNYQLNSYADSTGPDEYDEFYLTPAEEQELIEFAEEFAAAVENAFAMVDYN